MKTVYKFLTLVLMVLGCANALQAFEENSNPEQRIDQLITHGEGVSLLINGQWYGAEGIHAASDGILLLENGEWIPLDEVVKYQLGLWWKCPNPSCQKTNPQNIRYCVYCGRDRFS